MSDDIVTRLREYDFMRDGDTPDLTMAEAADEIKYLRTENDKASALIAKLVELLVPFSALMNKDEQKMLIKAVRGE